MKWKNSSEAWPSGRLKMFFPVAVESTLWWMCMALPGCPCMGLAMKVAYMLWRMATSRTVRLNRNTWSASGKGSPWSRLISICAVPISWMSVSSWMPWASHQSYITSKMSSYSLTESMEKLCMPASVRRVRPTGGLRGMSSSGSICTR